MISKLIEQSVRKALKHGNLTLREIARLHGISRESVRKISKSEEKTVEPLNREFRRCPECGGMVILPCLACGLKKNLEFTKKMKKGEFDEFDFRDC
jgi:predicted transcriptional regulator